MYDPLLQIVYYSIYNISIHFKISLFLDCFGNYLFQYRKIGKMEKGILGQYRKSPII